MSCDIRAMWELVGGKAPAHWDFITLEKLLETPKSVSVGVMYPGADTEGGVPLIKVSDVKNGALVGKPDFCISVEVDEEYKRTRLNGSELLITLVGNPGDCVLVTEEMKGWNAARALAVVRLKNLELREWLRYVLLSRPAKHIIDARLNTTVQKTLNLKDVKELPIPLPPANERDLITKNIRDIEKKLVLNTQTNQTLEQMAQAIFKSWFVDFDPVKAKMNGVQPEGMDATTASLFPEKLVESELGLIPDGWKVLPSEKVANVAIGKTPPRKEPQWFSEDNKDVTWISIRDMGKSGMYALDSSEYLTQESVDKFNVKVIPDNTLILSFKLTVGRVAITHGEMTTNEAIAHYKLSDDAPVSTNYLYSYMKQFNFESLGSTSSIAKAVNSKIIKALPVIVPSKDILGSFDTLVKPLFDKIKSNQIETQNLEVLRDTLLPKLLSGEIELGADEVMEPEV